MPLGSESTLGLAGPNGTPLIGELPAPADPAGGVSCAKACAGKIRLPSAKARTSAELRDIRVSPGAVPSTMIQGARSRKEGSPVFSPSSRPQKRGGPQDHAMSASPPKADIRVHYLEACFVPSRRHPISDASSHSAAGLISCNLSLAASRRSISLRFLTLAVAAPAHHHWCQFFIAARW
jgi:hypothetical protein